MRRRALSILACLGFLPSVSPAAELRVPSDHPTIQQAIDAALDGDTVLVEGGIHQEDLVVEGRTSLSLVGEEGARVEAIAGPALRVVDSSRFALADLKMVGVEGASVVEIEESSEVDLLRAVVVSGWWGLTVSNSDDVTLDEVRINRPRYTCLGIGWRRGWSERVEVRNSTLLDCGDHGIWMGDGREHRIVDTTIRRVHDGHGIYHQRSQGPEYRSLDIRQVAKVCVEVESGARLIDNVVEDCGRAGIWVQGWDNVLKRNLVESRRCALRDENRPALNHYVDNSFSSKCILDWSFDD